MKQEQLDFSREGKYIMNSSLETESSQAMPSGRNPAKRTRHHVDFFREARGAVVGDFDHWNPIATPWRRMPNGRWMPGLELPYGHRPYVFLVDGTPTFGPNASGIAHTDRNERVSPMAGR
jgi:hypothetical protein